MSACSKCYIFSTWECRGLGTIWAAGVWRQRGVERAIVVVVRRKQRRRLKPKKRVKYGETRGSGGSKTNQSRLTQWVTSGHCRWCQKRMHLPTTSPGLRRRLARSEECPSQVTSHTSHVTRHTSHVTRHTSHVTRHTSHVTQALTSTTVSLVHSTCCPHLLNRAAVATAACASAVSTASALAFMQKDSASTVSGMVDGGTP